MSVSYQGNHRGCSIHRNRNPPRGRSMPGQLPSGEWKGAEERGEDELVYSFSSRGCHARRHAHTRYFRAEHTFMDTDLLFFCQLLQLAICRVCRYHEIDELFSIEYKKSDQMVSGDCGKGD